MPYLFRITLLFLFFLPQTGWAQFESALVSHFESENRVRINDIVVDEQGDFYCIGVFEGLVFIDHGDSFSKVTSAAWREEIFICKYNSDNEFQWFKFLQGPNEEWPAELHVDKNGDLLITGQYRYDVDFDPSEEEFILDTENWWEPFLLKLDSDGNFIWVKNIYGAGISFSVDTDSQNNIVLSGWVEGHVDFDTGPDSLIIDTNDNDIFVSKLSPDGELMWARTFGGNSYDVSFSAVCDAEDNIVSTGWFRDTLEIRHQGQNKSLVSMGGNDAYILKLDKNGDFLWAHQIGSTSDDKGNRVRIINGTDVVSNVTVRRTDEFFTTIEGMYYPADIDYKQLYFSLDSLGNLNWHNYINSRVPMRGEDMVVDKNDNIYASGNFQVELEIEINDIPQTLDAPDDWDGYVIKMDPEGSFEWIEHVKSDSFLQLTALTINQDLEIIAAGPFRDNFSFMGYELEASNDFDSFIIKFRELASSTSVEDIPEFKIYPNPSDSYINIESTHPIDRVELLDVMGRTTLLPGQGNRFDVSMLSPGLYYCRLNGSQTIQTPIAIH